jgi:DNA-binding HxlR family transcriptional regulator
MRWRDIGDFTCSVARSLSIVGDRWTLLILRDAFLRTRRFEDFQAHLGITRHRLADRLRKLVEHGIFERVRYQAHPPRHEYRLTEKGRDLYPIIVSLVVWGDRWMADAAGVPVELIHRSCGQPIAPHLTCPVCGALVTARDIQAQPGPALKAPGAQGLFAAPRPAPTAARARPEGRALRHRTHGRKRA